MNPIHPFFTHIRGEHPNPENFDAFYSACHRPLRKCIRVNTLKISIADFQALALKKSWQLSPIPWCKEGFWLDDTDAEPRSPLGNSGEHLMGLFYIQEASSMLPAIALLSDRQAENVLDMTAAPGSKSTQLASIMGNKGTLLTNELSASRIKVLHANLLRSGVTNTCISHFDGTFLDKNISGFFDAILLDAPCGGEGSYRKDPKALDNWSVESIKNIAATQKTLLNSAWRMLQPGGRLVYSTCTLSRAENQDVVNALHHSISSEVTVIDLGDLFPGASRVVTKEGYLHIWPEIFDCEGFFIACLEKTKTATKTVKSAELSSQSPFKTLDNKTLDLVQQYYLQHFGFHFSTTTHLRIRNSKYEQQIWLFPESGAQLRKMLKLQRSGIRICDLIESRKGKRIKTAHEFIISYGHAFTRQVAELSALQANAFYKGENIIFEMQNTLTKGEALIRYQGYPLGLAKVLPVQHKTKTQDEKIRLTLKNNLPRELIRNNADF